MKAFLLAAGLGTRLRPLTNTTPKCLVAIAGKPLLEWWFVLLERHGVQEFLINTHHLPEQVLEFVERVAPRYHLRHRIVHEQKLIGSAGTIRENWDFVRDEADFLIVYADNLTDANLSEMVARHRQHAGLLTMALKRMDRPETRGIAELAADERITSFVEKPKEPKSNLANAGIYVVSQSIKPYFAEAFDIGFDVLPKLQGQMYGYELTGYLRDIGNPESLAAANEEWPRVAVSRTT